MCSFIRRLRNFGITITLLVLTIAPRQIRGRTELPSSNTQAGGASGSQESDYRDAPLALGEPIDRVLPPGERHSYKITLSPGQYLHLLVTPSGTELGTTLYAPDGQRLSQVTCRQKGPTPV